MKRSVGALLSCASSTSRTTRAMVLSDGSVVARMVSAASALTVPAKTGSPACLATGTLSPVTGASFTAPMPSSTSPSAGMRSPGRTRMTSPILRLSAGTSRVPEPSTRRAVLGTKAVSARMESRARPAAKPSSNSPTRKRKTTAAASSEAPMITAPTAAMVISISMEKGVPAKAAATARRAIGISPTSSAAMKIHGLSCGRKCPRT